jgi:hypothetical protein
MAYRWRAALGYGQPLDSRPPFRSFSTLPGISILTPTYGRTRRLPGLIQSYLQQDYAGPCELIILNDRHDQRAVLDAVTDKQVTILNADQQFVTLGEKRNRLVSLATFPFVCWWDDDDRYLPGHLTTVLGQIRTGYRGAMPSHIWLDEGGQVPILHRPWSPFANAIMEKQAILDAGGFPAQQMHQDVALATTMHYKLKVFHAESDTGMPTCVYRKPGSSDHNHVGEFAEVSNSAAARAYMQGSVDSAIQAGVEPAGVVAIQPKWERDYTTWCATAWAARAP